MKKTILLCAILLIALGCSKDEKPSEINIRLSNVSSYSFENIVVNTGTGEVSFENIDPGELTDYKTFDIAYHYAFVELQIDGGKYTLQPIDYVGETPLKPGFYTYQINANDTREQYTRLSLVFIED